VTANIERGCYQTRANSARQIRSATELAMHSEPKLHSDMARSTGSMASLLAVTVFSAIDTAS
jgi:hypothetical protein